MELWETGLTLYWVKINVPDTPKCFAKVEPPARQVAIQLKDLIGVFFVLGFGLCLSSCAFALEMIYSKFKNYEGDVKETHDYVKTIPAP